MIFPLFKLLQKSVIYLMLLGFYADASQTDNPIKTIQVTSPQWQQTLKAAQGKSVFFYAWGGSPAVNEYLRWAAKEIANQYRVRLLHVKLAEPSESVSRLQAENGRTSAIDLTWVNGENFAFLKQQGYLLGNLWSNIPNAANLAVESLPLSVDFGEPVDGYEVPWGIGQFNLMGDKTIYPESQVNAQSLLNFAKNHPNSISYPRPPEFHGTTFLKQLLVDLTHADKRLYQPITRPVQEELLPVLWQYLDQLHPLLWQQGKAFPSSAAEQFLLFQQKNLSMTVSFNPSQWSKEMAKNTLPKNVERLYFKRGAITNSHYIAIPKTAPNIDAAKVVLQFLLSEKAQQKKYQGGWGDPSVLRTLQDENVTLPAQAEPHSSWHVVIEDVWQQRYGG
jgi:putative thiamine transport system substrate-binding protein